MCTVMERSDTALPRRGCSAASSGNSGQRFVTLFDCPQRLMSRVLVRTGVLPNLAGAGEGKHDLYCDGKTCTFHDHLQVFLAIPAGGMQ
jgi:hypothetical protein